MTTCYSCYISYRDLKSERSYDSGMGMGEDNLHKLLEDMSYHIQYYKNLGYRITEIKVDQICKACNGNGEVFIPNKRNRFIGKNVRCPDCKGKNSSVSIVSTTNNDGSGTYQ
jgi:hypothetical protein